MIYGKNCKGFQVTVCKIYQQITAVNPNEHLFPDVEERTPEADQF